ncbi:WD40 repeat-like protein, partial [Imleria badia]
IRSVAFLVDGKHVVSGGEGRKIRCWRVEDGEEVGTPMDAGIPLCSQLGKTVDVSPDGTRIATSSKDKTTCIWSLSTGQRLLGPLEHDDWVVAAKFSPDGR